jgi:hypothetical protein
MPVIPTCGDDSTHVGARRSRASRERNPYVRARLLSPSPLAGEGWGRGFGTGTAPRRNRTLAPLPKGEGFFVISTCGNDGAHVAPASQPRRGRGEGAGRYGHDDATIHVLKNGNSRRTVPLSVSFHSGLSVGMKKSRALFTSPFVGESRMRRNNEQGRDGFVALLAGKAHVAPALPTCRPGSEVRRGRCRGAIHRARFVISVKAGSARE